MFHLPSNLYSWNKKFPTRFILNNYCRLNNGELILVTRCQLCNRNVSSDSIWKNQQDIFCSNCATVKLLSLEYRGISSEAEEELVNISREIEKLINRGREEETLHLTRKGLTLLDKMVVPESAFGCVSQGIFYFNEAMKKADRLDSIRFFKERVFLNGGVTFVSVALYQRKKPDLENWKFFIGHVPRNV